MRFLGNDKLLGQGLRNGVSIQAFSRGRGDFAR